ncbi:MAG TPA: N-acetylglutaminylglutamine amidotransferase [Egibacteraceae bacterium]|nr:N-acetylglutaminylglutamine amidotransferase [Egibacteraceae bacterium]
MCGFSGEVRTDAKPADTFAVQRMTAAMLHRGPDGSGLYAHGPVALGHCRLKVVDLSTKAAQPMVDSYLGLTIAFNGLIYNYEELRRELSSRGYRFFSTGDTEVLLKAYHAWGVDFVDRLQGMFAFCITERDTGRVVFGRDRLGIKPLYLAESPGRIRFASTLPALLAGGQVDTDVDPVALHHYLTFHAVVPAPRSILKGVRKLPPATVLVVEADGRQHRRTYWRPSFVRDPAHADWSARDWQDAVLGALRVAVSRRLVADVPVGVLLSGGLDSSLIVGLLAEAGQKNLVTYSIGFDAVGGEQGDEFAYSDVVARTFGTDHHRIRITSERMLPALGDAIAAMSEPMMSHDAVAFYLLSEEVARTMKVVQSGQGADEVFAGYSWYPPLLPLPPGESGVAPYRDAFFDRLHSEMPDLVSPEYLVAADVSTELVAQHFAMEGAETAVDRALRLDTTVMLVDDPLKRVDNMTMAWGLEARVPFLDHELVELAASCPPGLKLAHGGKGVLKEAARRVIPSAVIDRPKGYFPVPALKYLRGPYLDLVREALTAPAAKERGLFQPAYVNELLADPEGQLTRPGASKLFQLGVLELWLQAHDV